MLPLAAEQAKATVMTAAIHARLMFLPTAPCDP
jgi:hypothetical protein